MRGRINTCNCQASIYRRQMISTRFDRGSLGGSWRRLGAIYSLASIERDWDGAGQAVDIYGEIEKTHESPQLQLLDPQWELVGGLEGGFSQPQAGQSHDVCLVSHSG